MDRKREEEIMTGDYKQDGGGDAVEGERKTQIIVYIVALSDTNSFMC